MCDQDHFEDRPAGVRGSRPGDAQAVRRDAGSRRGDDAAAGRQRGRRHGSGRDVTTPDGAADCYFVHPASGTAPAVLVWPDIFGLRPAFRQMGKRLAESGYSVLVVNPFYRAKKAPTAERARATPIQESEAAGASSERDDAHDGCEGFHRWLDGQASVAKNRKVGTQGYCMGGPMAFRTAAAVPDRVGAVASFHGGGLVTDSRTVRICRPRRPRRSS